MNTIDLSFSITGGRIPADHGFPLFAAISRAVPKFHELTDAGIHPISGVPIGERLILLNEKSRMTIRLDSDRIKDVLNVAGKKLDIDGHQIGVGVPNTRALIPSTSLYSRHVIIKGFMEPEGFLEAAQRQIDRLEVKGKASLVYQPEIAEANKDRKSGTHSEYLRRTIRIHDKEIVGFALRVSELTAEESIILQENGIGGRRRFGCGIFIPYRRC